jgi:hypothetical protein
MTSSLTPNAEFHMYVGFCITAWAKVEEQLFRICVECLKTSDEKTAIVYYRTPSLSARLELLDELVRATLPRKLRKSGGHDLPIVKSWKDIYGEAKNLLGTRRRIANVRTILCSLRNRYQESESRGIQKSPFSLRDCLGSGILPFGPSARLGPSCRTFKGGYIMLKMLTAAAASFAMLSAAAASGACSGWQGSDRQVSGREIPDDAAARSDQGLTVLLP